MVTFVPQYVKVLEDAAASSFMSERVSERRLLRMVSIPPKSQRAAPHSTLQAPPASEGEAALPSHPVRPVTTPAGCRDKGGKGAYGVTTGGTTGVRIMGSCFTCRRLGLTLTSLCLGVNLHPSQLLGDSGAPWGLRIPTWG